MLDLIRSIAPQWRRQTIDQATRVGEAHPRQIAIASKPGL